MVRTAPWHDIDYFYDAAGRLVLLGERVAYNLSSTLAVGKVERVRVQRWKASVSSRFDPYRITISYEKGHRGHQRGHESIVRGTEQVLTLEHYKLGGD